jgi:HK97 family phage portal protein
MKNGGAMGILSPGPNSPEMTSVQAADLKEQIAKRRGGNELIDRIFASGATLNWQQIGLPVSDMMLLESLQFDRTDIANIYHIPITLLNDMSASTDNNVSAHMKQFIYNCVMPLANLISDKLTRDICPAYNTPDKKYVIQIDTTTLPDMQEDMGNVANWMNTSWWLTPNQKLQGMGFGESREPNMDKIIIPSSYTLLDDLSMTDANFTQAGQNNNIGNGANNNGNNNSGANDSSL